MENGVKVSLKTKSRTTISSSNPTPQHISREKTWAKIIHEPQCSLQHSLQHCLAMTWKQPKCPYIQWNSHKKEQNDATCCIMDGSRDYHSEVIQAKTDMILFICEI